MWNTFFPTSAWGGGTHTINVGVHLVTDEKGRDDFFMWVWGVAPILWISGAQDCCPLSVSPDVVLDATSSEYRWVSASEIYREHDAYVQELAQEIGL